jgi:predicted NBD/HSP70 family sugar kinase
MNTSLVMREIWTSHKTSRIEIARAVGLDKSTVSAIVGDLLSIGVIIESDEGPAGPSGGRRPVNITLNPRYGAVLGLELRPGRCAAVGVDLTGEVVFSHAEATEAADHALPGVLFKTIEKLEGKLHEHGLPLIGVGVGLSGVVDPNSGIVVHSIPLKVDGPLPLAKEMSEQLTVPFYVENDANACAWGELAFHRQHDLRDMVFVLVELNDVRRAPTPVERIGVGLGLVINGRVHHGYHFSAGEFRSIFRDASSSGQFDLSSEDAVHIESDSDILRRFLVELAKHIALFVNTFNLSHVFVGGDIENVDGAPEALRGILTQEIANNWPYPVEEADCTIAFSSLHERAVAYGAAGMVLERIFSDPELVSGIVESRDRSDQTRFTWPHRPKKGEATSPARG